MVESSLNWKQDEVFLLGDTLQDFDQQLGSDLDILDLAGFIGRMHVNKRRTNGDHVQVGILLRKGAALHAGVYRLHDHIRAGQVLVGLASDMGQLAVGIDRPAGNMTLAVEDKTEAIGQCAADHTDLSGLILLSHACLCAGRFDARIRSDSQNYR